jgi:hypothetical protein
MSSAIPILVYVAISKGYGFVGCVLCSIPRFESGRHLPATARFFSYYRSLQFPVGHDIVSCCATTSDPPLSRSIRALTEMQGLTAGLVPVCDDFSFANCFMSDFFGTPLSALVASAADEDAPDTILVTVCKAGNIPVLIDPTALQHLRRVTGTVADSHISKNNYCRDHRHRGVFSG